MDFIEIKKRRIMKGFSQAKMARELGVHLNTYSLWERGCGKPSDENLKKLERILVGIIPTNKKKDGKI